MQFKKIVFFIISITILFTGCGEKEDNKVEIKKETIKKENIKKNIIYTLIDENSKQIDIEQKEDKLIFKQLKGKAVLINFWATWCPPCKAEIPHLVTLKDKYKEIFEIIAVNMGERTGNFLSNEKMKKFMNDYKINYRVTSSTANYDLADGLGGVRAIPTMFLFDKEGKLVQKYTGIVPKEMIETDIKKALRK